MGNMDCVSSGLPVLLYVMRGYTNSRSPSFAEAWLVWEPVISAASIITIVRPYRRAILSTLGVSSGAGSTVQTGTIELARQTVAVSAAARTMA